MFKRAGGRLILYAALAYVVASTLDLSSTALALSRVPGAFEMNPLVASLIKRGAWVELVALNVIVPVAALSVLRVACWLLGASDRFQALGSLLLIMVASARALAGASNVSLVLLGRALPFAELLMNLCGAT